MSMSQEEIEALMNGLDFDDSEESSNSKPENSESQESMSEEDINDLIAQTEEISTETVDSVDSSKDEKIDDILLSIEETQEEESDNETNIDDILKELETEESSEDSSLEDETTNLEDIEEIINHTPTEEILDEDQTQQVVASSENIVESKADESIDDILSSIDGIDEQATSTKSSDDSDDSDDDLDYKISSGVFPLPVEEDTKVVNQLSAVASDSEEKATKIFDVLSNILDYNNAIQQDINALNSFNERQVAMLSSLSSKFPNIEVFQQNLNHALQMGEHITDANEKLNDGNTEIFQAMELMQFHDINRQKIERVMSVIRKLSSYLNNLFEDESNRDEVAVAKHIHGDSTEDLLGDDDLESLIAEFNK